MMFKLQKFIVGAGLVPARLTIFGITGRDKPCPYNLTIIKLQTFILSNFYRYRKVRAPMLLSFDYVF